MSQALPLPTCSPPGRMEALGQRHMARDGWVWTQPRTGPGTSALLSLSERCPRRPGDAAGERPLSVEAPGRMHLLKENVANLLQLIAVMEECGLCDARAPVLK